MNSIGFRVSPTEIHYAIIVQNGELYEYNISAIAVPPALDPPDQFRYLRTNLLDVLREFSIERAGIRLAEHVAPQSSQVRLNIEGVIQEMLASSDVERYFYGLYGCKKDDHVFLAMPLYERGSLSSKMSQQYLTVREIVKYGLDFLTGLHHIHTVGLTHSDVKPNNVLLERSDRALLTDFGLAQFVDTFGFAEQQPFYTLHVSPERCQQQQVTQSSDIYQAGVTLYRMCNGDQMLLEDAELHWQSGGETEFMRQVIAGNFPDRHRYLPQIPVRLRNIIRKSSRPDPDSRYQTVTDLMYDLARVDDALDWQYFYDQGEGEHRWTRVEDTHTKNIEVSSNVDERWESLATRTTHTSGNTQRITDACGQFETEEQALGLVEDFIKGID